jgi:hypothetical protein
MPMMKKQAKNMIAIALTVGLFVSNIPISHSQSPESILTGIPDSANAQSYQGTKTKIWSPEILLGDNEYYIMIQDVPANEKYSIISNNEQIVQILKQDEFADTSNGFQIIKIRANNPGETDIFAVNEKSIFSKKITVVEPTLKATKLKLILPLDMLNVKRIPAYVVLTDDSGNPIPAHDDIKVDIRSFGNVEVDQNNIVIKKGQHYSNFVSRINGDGGITVATSGLESDTKKITLEAKEDVPVLNVRVAPNPIPPSSSAMVYLWFEQGNRPFVPKEDVKITLTTEDPKFLTFLKDGRFNASPTTKSLSSSTTITLKAGQSYTKTKVFSTDFISEFNPDFGPDLRHEELSANEVNQYTITAVADGFDGKQTHIKIQPAKTVKSLAQSNREIPSTPTNTKVWAYPNNILDEFDIIVAVYTQIKDTKNTVTTNRESNTQSFENVGSVDDIGTTENIDNICSSCAPLVITESNVGVYVSAGDLAIAPNNVVISANSFISKENYVIIPAKSMGFLGTSKISAVVDGTTGDEFNIEVKQPFTKDLQLGITPIPIISNQEQDLFMIYSLRSNAVSNDTIKELAVSTNPKIDITGISSIDSVKIVKGKVNPLSQDTRFMSVTALATGIESTSSKLTIFDPQKQIKLVHPQKIKLGQPFPLFVYVVDERGNPISTFVPVEPPSNVIEKLDDGLFKTTTGGKINFAVSVDGFTSVTTIDSIPEPINLNVLPSRTQINSGETLDLLYAVYPSSSKVSLNTDLRFDEIDNGFRVYGAEPGEHTLLITAQNDGEGTTSQELKIKINENNLQTEPTQLDYFKTNYLFVAILIVASATGVLIFVKKKLKLKPKNYEEDLTF